MSDILFLAHRVPFPPDRGDKIRAYNILCYLGQRARVHLIAFGDDARDVAAGEGLAPLVASVTVIERRKSRARSAVEALVTGRPISLTAFDNPAMRIAVEACLARESIGAIYAFSGQMAQYLPIGGARVVMDFVDVDSTKFADYAARARGSKAWLMAREAQLLGKFERTVAARADASLFVSAAEAALFCAGGGVGHIAVVENGIDTTTFDPAARFDRVEEAGPLIVFTGQMDYPPNIEAATSFARDLLPMIRQLRPDARFAIVGRAPTASVRALARDPAVVVTGEVTDVRGWLAAAAVVVAPLKLARGIQNKVLEAMAMARPVVASAAAAEGIDHAGTIRVAGDAVGLVDAVIGLLDNPADTAALGRAARARTIARYGWEARLAPLDALLDLASPLAERPAA